MWKRSKKVKGGRKGGLRVKGRVQREEELKQKKKGGQGGVQVREC